MDKEFYGQYGEDEWIYSNLELPTNGIYLDIGAGDGENINNTYFLEKKGWLGLCIEADPRNYDRLREIRKLIWCGAVRNYNGFTNLYQDEGNFESSSVIYSQVGKSIKIPCRRIRDLLKENNIGKIDYFSIDIEGGELEILKDFDFENHQPSIIIVEFLTLPHKDKEDELIKFFQLLPYEIVHKTYCNLILERKD